MKILLASTAPYLSNFTGANKINRALVEQLAQRGHSCRVIALQRPMFSISVVDREPLAERTSASGSDITTLNGVEVHSVGIANPGQLPQLRGYLESQIRSFDPTWILISSEDWGQFLLQAAVETAADRVIYLAHTPAALPFGPDALMPNPLGTKLLQQAAGIISLSHFLSEFIRQWSGCEALTVYPHAYGDGPFPSYGQFDHGYVTMVNPCTVKGISIFLDLARAFPSVPFAAVLSWGTTVHDRDALDALPNVTMIPPTEDIESFFAQTRILLVPSLWHEAFGLVVVEALLRGIPVIASNAGGLPEAKLNTNFVLPVNPIVHYEMDSDRSLAKEVPSQDLGPWIAALEQLLNDRALYERESALSREAASAFLQQIGVEAYERAFAEIATRVAARKAERAAAQAQQAELEQRLAQLSPKKRALFEALRRKT